MDLATFEWLLTDDGQTLLAEAAQGDPSETAQLRELERLRRLTTPARAAAAFEIATLRRRAAGKFSLADRLYFTREALEQASGEVVARHRATRYVGRPHIADLCCGVGGDTLALAAVARVTAVDRDPLRLAMAAANARAAGLDEQVRFVAADLEQAAPPAADAIFFDPARRSGGRRIFALADYQPPVALVRRWRAQTPPIGVKVAPGVADDELADLGELEVEFVSLDGELKEAVLWLGPLATPGRRASLLTTGAPGAATLFVPAGAALPSPPLAEPSGYLYEPDPAVLRARAVQLLAAQLGAAQLDRTIAYLVAPAVVATPFARCWRVLEWMPFAQRRLEARLRALGAGPVSVKKRGSPLDADALARRLSGHGPRPLVVVLTQVAGRHSALICEGPLTD